MTFLTHGNLALVVQQFRVVLSKCGESEKKKIDITIFGCVYFVRLDEVPV